MHLYNTVPSTRAFWLEFLVFCLIVFQGKDHISKVLGINSTKQDIL